MFGLLAGLCILTALFALCALLIRPDETTAPRASVERSSPTAARPAAGPRRSGPERASDTANSGGRR